MIHYHGTPITPQKERIKMAGKHFCVSYADARDADWCLHHGQSVMWDNGAYTAFTQRKTLDFHAYYEWLEPRLGQPHWAVIPDVIDGNEEAQRCLINTWPYSRFVGAPVWHMGLSIDWLLDLADNWPRLCFGSSGKYWQVGSDMWRRRADEAFNALAQRHSTLPWVHMLRGLSLSGDRWPFASADSVNVARNFKDQKTCPEFMARRIDAVQTPVQWKLTPLQGCMLEKAS